MTMQQTKPNPIIHLLPSLTDVAFLMPLLFMFTKLDGAKALLSDGDTGWHIRTGEWILANHRVPHNDIFSFTKPGAPWFAWEWLSDVIFGWLHQHWGLAGVVLLGMLLICCTSALVFRLVLRRCSNPLVAIALTFLVVASTSIHWHARPHLFTLLLVITFLHLLDRARNGRWRLLWLTVPLTLVWTNLHGGFFVGIILIGCYAAGEIIAWFISSDPAARRAALVRAARFAGAAAACGTVSLVNPYGYHLHVFIAEYLRAPYLDIINEFMSPNFHQFGALFYEILLFAALGAVGWALVTRRFADALMTLGWAHLSVFSARNIPVFAIVAAPITAAAVETGLRRIAASDLASRFRQRAAGFLSFGVEVTALDSPWRTHVFSCVVVVLLAAALLQPGPAGKLAAGFDPEHFPVKAAIRIRSLGPSARVFTLDQWGDYLIYSGYPDARVYMDGRSDFYGNTFVTDYVKLIGGQDQWEKSFQRFRINAVLLPVDSPLTTVLKRVPAWRPTYDDGKAIVFESAAVYRNAPGSAVKPEQSRGLAITSRQGYGPEAMANDNHDHTITTHKSL